MIEVLEESKKWQSIGASENDPKVPPLVGVMAVFIGVFLDVIQFLSVRS